MRGFFIAGTDTEIGKTTVTAGLTYLCASIGLLSLAIKPLAAGQDFVDNRWINEDVLRLRAASNMSLTDAQVGPLQLRTPCAPHIAAKIENITIDRETLLAKVKQTLTLSEVGFVEGVGGFRVPLTADWDTADMATDFNLPVILVVGIRLGCINHALLTAEAIHSRGLQLAGWIANSVDPAMSYIEDNLAALSAEINAPCWGQVPRLQDPNPAAVAAHLNLSALRQTLEIT
ncbi:dethiobiotin synthase [Zwartia sp.]|uniref:dethiobiotin synthase n=1 Tax=Zwartia sp. TaxID=2978004 RepID=UPI003BB1E8B6